MTEELSTGDWATPAEMEHWRDQVRQRAEARLATGITKTQAIEIQQPEAAAHALYLLAETDLSRTEIGRRTGIARQHVDRLAYNNAMSLEKRRPEIGAKFAENADNLATLTGRKIALIMEDDEELKKTSLKDLSISMGVNLDKAAQMVGMATTIIEHRSGPTIEDAQREIQAARDRLAERAKARCIEAEVIPPASSVPDSDDY